MQPRVYTCLGILFPSACCPDLECQQKDTNHWLQTQTIQATTCFEVDSIRMHVWNDFKLNPWQQPSLNHISFLGVLGVW